MFDFNEVSKTLFMPMEARVFCGINFPEILYDEKVLSIENKLPQDLFKSQNQSEYILVNSAVRSLNMDKYVGDFLHTNSDGVIVELGIGLETLFYRSKDAFHRWFGIDFPEVISYRRDLLGTDERQTLIGGSIFDETLMHSLREQVGNHPVLFVASGLFQYFQYNDVIKLLNRLKSFYKAEIVFDCVSKIGMIITNRSMKHYGYSDEYIHFYIQKISDLVDSLDGKIKVLHCQRFYSWTKHMRGELKISTKLSMMLSDLFFMTKMVHLSLSQ